MNIEAQNVERLIGCCHGELHSDDGAGPGFASHRNAGVRQIENQVLPLVAGTDIGGLSGGRCVGWKCPVYVRDAIIDSPGSVVGIGGLRLNMDVRIDRCAGYPRMRHLDIHEE